MLSNVHLPKIVASYFSNFLVVHAGGQVWPHHDCKHKSVFLLISLLDIEDLKGISKNLLSAKRSLEPII